MPRRFSASCRVSDTGVRFLVLGVPVRRRCKAVYLAERGYLSTTPISDARERVVTNESVLAHRNLIRIRDHWAGLNRCDRHDKVCFLVCPRVQHFSPVRVPC